MDLCFFFGPREMGDEIQSGHNDASVIFERFGDEVVAIHLGTGRYYSLPGAAGDAFLLLAGNSTVPEIAEALSAKYDAPVQVITSDLGDFLQQLKDESLIVNRTGGDRKGDKSRNADLSSAPLEPRVPYTALVVHAHRDLENLFLVDPIHEAGEAGWPEVKKPAEPAAGTPLRYSLASERCLFEQFDEATIALNLNTGAYFSFSGPSEDMLLLLYETPTRAEIVQALETKYAASTSELSEAVDRFMNRLLQSDLILAEEIDGEPECRTLKLARPGDGQPFTAPEIEMYRDAPGSLLWRTGPVSWISLSFVGQKKV